MNGSAAVSEAILSSTHTIGGVRLPLDVLARSGREIREFAAWFYERWHPQFMQPMLSLEQIATGLSLVVSARCVMPADHAHDLRADIISASPAPSQIAGHEVNQNRVLIRTKILKSNDRFSLVVSNPNLLTGLFASFTKLVLSMGLSKNMLRNLRLARGAHEFEQFESIPLQPASTTCRIDTDGYWTLVSKVSP